MSNSRWTGAEKNDYLAPTIGPSLIFQGVSFLEKCDELFELVAFAQKLRYFTDQNGPKGRPHENEFKYFQVPK